MNLEQLLQSKFNIPVSILDDYAYYTDILDTEYMVQYPHRAPELFDSMRLVRPYDDMRSYIRDVQEHHVRELFQRVADNADIYLPTHVEMLMVILHASRHAPLKYQPTLLAGYLVKHILGDDDTPKDALLVESYDGQIEELKQEMQHDMVKLIQRDKPDPTKWYALPVSRRKTYLRKATDVPDYVFDVM